MKSRLYTASDITGLCSESGVPERQKGKGGGAAFQGALSILYAQSLLPTLQKYCQTIKHVTKATE